jgi:hypothetical protein
MDRMTAEARLMEIDPPLKFLPDRACQGLADAHYQGFRSGMLYGDNCRVNGEPLTQCDSLNPAKTGQPNAVHCVSNDSRYDFPGGLKDCRVLAEHLTANSPILRVSPFRRPGASW